MNVRIIKKQNLAQIMQYPWIWSVIGSVIMFILLGILAGRTNWESLMTLCYSASFLTIVALGQMLIVTTGEGAIDLSISTLITLSAFLATGLTNTTDSNLIWVIPLVLLIGVFFGFINSVLVVFLRIPAIIATLAMSYVITTVVLLYNNIFRVFSVAPALTAFVRFEFFGSVPLMILIIILLLLLFQYLINHTRYGKSLIALGQSLKAAELAGVSVKTVKIMSYCFCGFLSALGGILISARVGGAFLGLGDPYQMQTVAAVVVGGTLISGGRAVPVGTFFGALFLTFLTTAMQIAGINIGMQNIITGFFIIFVLFLSARTKEI